MVFKLLHVALLASFKYILTIPYAMLIGLEYKEALLAVLAGGIGGFLFFYYLSGWVIQKSYVFWSKTWKKFPASIKSRFRILLRFISRKRPRKVFTRKNRLIARLRNNYGFWGIIIATPVFLTIPLGAFLTNKYYAGRKHVVAYMVLSIIGWALLLTAILQLFPGILG
ncbi:hypothetical protein MNBD_BACTEROID01-109 [hydrothermal vent metagenome]|uniref:Uncharacterized protein n=1 Tax=hydrothermal vent metagenome TaxID=652676 RepID=A0A3B0TVP2_9ZZZZ